MLLRIWYVTCFEPSRPPVRGYCLMFLRKYGCSGPLVPFLYCTWTETDQRPMLLSQNIGSCTCPCTKKGIAATTHSQNQEHIAQALVTVQRKFTTTREIFHRRERERINVAPSDWRCVNSTMERPTVVHPSTHKLVQFDIDVIYSVKSKLSHQLLMARVK